MYMTLRLQAKNITHCHDGLNKNKQMNTQIDVCAHALVHVTGAPERGTVPGWTATHCDCARERWHGLLHYLLPKGTMGSEDWGWTPAFLNLFFIFCEIQNRCSIFSTLTCFNILKNIWFVCVLCVCLRVRVHAFNCLQKAVEGVGSPGSRKKDVCESPDKGAGKQTLVLCKQMCS